LYGCFAVQLLGFLTQTLHTGGAYDLSRNGRLEIAGDPKKGQF
jgi:hypothetical protein